MTIGNVTIAGKAALAPMAGVADRAFRKLCVENGAAYVVGEMVSCKGLCFGDAKSEELLSLDRSQCPLAETNHSEIRWSDGLRHLLNAVLFHFLIG